MSENWAFTFPNLKPPQFQWIAAKCNVSIFHTSVSCLKSRNNSWVKKRKCWKKLPQNNEEIFVFEKKIPRVCRPICVCSSVELCSGRIYYIPTSIILTPNLLYWNKWNMFKILPFFFDKFMFILHWCWIPMYTADMDNQIV